MDAVLAENLPLYKSHKEVRGAKILEIRRNDGNEVRIRLDVGDGLLWPTTFAWLQRFSPKEGDYVVLYADGYISVSPPQAFEAGYVLVRDSPDSPAAVQPELANAPVAGAEFASRPIPEPAIPAPLESDPPAAAPNSGAFDMSDYPQPVRTDQSDPPIDAPTQ